LLFVNDTAAAAPSVILIVLPDNENTVGLAGAESTVTVSDDDDDPPAGDVIPELFRVVCKICSNTCLPCSSTSRSTVCFARAVLVNDTNVLIAVKISAIIPMYTKTSISMNPFGDVCD
jgi:hypothetical protein